jgi:serine/threonine-protein kinase
MMKRIADRLRRSLGARLFFYTGLLVLALVLAAVGVTAWVAGRVSRESALQSLSAARDAQARFERERVAALRRIARYVAGDPNFVAYVVEGDAASIADLLGERQREMECDFAAVLDRQGRVVARTDRPGGGGDWSATPLVRRAMREGEATGPWTDGRRFWIVVAVPLVTGGTTGEGLLLAGIAVDDALALEVRRQSGAEIAYVAIAPKPRVVATTLPDGASLAGAVGGAGELARLADAGADAPPGRWRLGGRPWAVRATRVAGEAGGSDGGAASPELATVTLASLDLALAPFRRIEQALLWVGITSLVAAFAVSYWISRRVTRPIAQLADAAVAARDRRYDIELPPSGEDEVGRLGGALRSLISDLKDEREMEAYLQMISRSLPDTPPVPPGASLAPGARLGGRFEILGWIGAGGFGAVYKARDRELNDVVALKVLHASHDAGALERLKAELRIARRITHRNVLRTHDFGEADRVPFISMEYVRGVTLRELLMQAPRLPVSVGLRIARELLSGLEAAHAMGVVHRDVKPENLILEASGQVKIMDFGIARARGDVADAKTIGTLGYLSPEQLAGEPGDERSDLYATGVVMFEMFAGRRPFMAASTAELTYRIMNEEPPLLREHGPKIPPAVEAAILRCLARDAGDRYARACELADKLAEGRA